MFKCKNCGSLEFCVTWNLKPDYVEYNEKTMELIHIPGEDLSPVTVDKIVCNDCGSEDIENKELLIEKINRGEVVW